MDLVVCVFLIKLLTDHQYCEYLVYIVYNLCYGTADTDAVISVFIS